MISLYLSLPLPLFLQSYNPPLLFLLYIYYSSTISSVSRSVLPSGELRKSPYLYQLTDNRCKGYY